MAGSGGPPRLPRLGSESNFLLGQSRKAVIDAALGTRPWAEQPQELKRVVNQKVWDGLSKDEKVHLAAVYNKMESYGLWKHVTAMVKVKQDPQAHALCLPGSHAVPGSEGFVFETGNSQALYEDIFAAGFGTDGAAESMLHKGQTSTRESTPGAVVTHELAAPDGLHVSISGKLFDAHVDKVSPTNSPQAGATQMDVQRGWLHHRHERVWAGIHSDLASLVEKETKLEVPGVDIKLTGLAGGPSLDPGRLPMPEDRNNPTAPVMADVTLRFGKK